MHQYQETDGEEDRKPGGKTYMCKRDTESAGLKEEDIYNTGLDNAEVLCSLSFR